MLRARTRFELPRLFAFSLLQTLARRGLQQSQMRAALKVQHGIPLVLELLTCC